MEKNKFEPLNKLHQLSCVISIITCIGLIGTNKYYNKLDIPEAHLKYQQISKEISILENAKNRINDLENSKDYNFSSLNCNSDEINRELTNLYDSQRELECDKGFKKHNSREKTRKSLILLLGIPWGLSTSYNWFKIIN
jgi:hypothetical protein